MPKHIVICGIPGSGKGEVTDHLASILAAELNATVGCFGKTISIVANDQDHFFKGFHPWPLSWKAHFAQWCKKWSERFRASQRWHPVFRLLHLFFQDVAARETAEKKSADIFFTTGHPVISLCGSFSLPVDRVVEPGCRRDYPSIRELFSRVFYYLLVGGKCLPDVRNIFPQIDLMRRISRIAKYAGCRELSLPDRIFFLDCSPAIALHRMEAEGRVVPRHNALRSLEEERENYLTALRVFQEYRGGSGSVHTIKVDDRSLDRIIYTIVTILKEHEDIGGDCAGKKAGIREIGTKVRFSGLRWFYSYFLGRWFRGSWRDPLFSFSRSGRRFLDQGYTAHVIRGLYDGDPAVNGIMERIFTKYPLHRAINERLRIVSGNMEKIVKRKLVEYGEITVFFGPCGFAYDIFKPLETIAASGALPAGRIRLILTDPDPTGTIEPELATRAKRLGVRLTFIKGDIWSTPVRKTIQHSGPFDIALLIGCTHWLPKRQLLSHLRWISRTMDWDSILLTDCFTPDAYSLAACYSGYKTNYYHPRLFGTILDYCGFDGDRAVVSSGGEGINHVIVTCPRYSLEGTQLNVKEDVVAA